MALEKTPMPMRSVHERIGSFEEAALGYSKEMAMAEAERCLDCPGRYCQQQCPLHNPVPDIMTKVRHDDLEGAYELLQQSSPMPAICSRVCAQEKQCEMNCTRGIKGEPVAIGNVERFLADWAVTRELVQGKNGESQNEGVAEAVGVAKDEACSKAGSQADDQADNAAAGIRRHGGRIAIVGSGPAGLACAGRLAQHGCRVSVFEKETYAGGVLQGGIPEFILPKRTVDAQVLKLTDLGVEFKTNHKINHTQELLDQGFDAVFLALGAGKPIQMGIAGEKMPGVYSASEFLKKINIDKAYDNNQPEFAPGKTVVVIGGGNTAMDVSRSAVRMGAKKVYVLYRRSEDEMPARREEILRAREEGVEILELAVPVAFKKNGNDSLAAIECIRTVLVEEEYPGGRRRIRGVKGSNFEIQADMAVLAVGYRVDTIQGVKWHEKGTAAVKRDGVTAMTEGVFAGGDVVTGAKTVVHAIRAGIQGADAILATLRADD